MTYLGGSVAALATDRNAWHTRADQAYGPARTWNTAPSFEDQAWTGTGYGSGQLWSDAAHDDPNVWTNRYNAGVTAAQPAALSDQATSAGSGAASWNAWTSLGGTLSAPYAGYYAVSFEMRLNNNNHNDDTDYVQLRILGAGSPIVTSPQQGKSKQPVGSYHSYHYAQATVQLTAGTVLQGQVYSFSQNSDPSCTFDAIVLRARFMPTPAQPH